MKPKRVLHVIGGLYRGGTEAFIMNMYRNIDKEKFQFDFIIQTTEEGAYEQEVKELGGGIYRINSRKKVGSIKHSIELYQAIKQINPDIIHTHLMFSEGIALFFAKVIGIKRRIAHSHNTGEDITANIPRRIYRSISRILIKYNATNFAACGTKAAEYLYGKIRRMKKQIVILHNGIDLEDYTSLTVEASREMKNMLGIPSDAMVLGHIGRFAEQKNHTFIIKVFKEMPVNSVLLLVGDGPDMDNIKQLATDAGVVERVLFLGLRNDIPLILNMLDVFLFPSLYEGLPVVMIEVQASGVPSVISDTIDKEVDLNLGLVNFVSLNSSIETWVSHLIKSASIKRNDQKDIIHQIKEHGYDSKIGANNLMKLYEV